MVDLVEVAKKWQNRWFQDKIFEPEIDENKEKFFFTVPYPYVSGALHVGHGRVYAVGDAYARYKRMKGYNVLWPMAFHITGTPVLAVSKQIAARDEKTIKLFKEYVGLYEKDAKEIEKIVNSFVEPWNVVKYFSSKLIHDFKSIGLSIDWSRQFTTGDPDYNQFITWQFMKYAEKGYLTQAEYPVLYCISCENAAGEDDIKDGDTNPVSHNEFTGVPFESDEGILMASTLRPETIFGVTNLFLNPDETYVKIKMEKEYIVSKICAEKLKMQNKKFDVVEEIAGKKLVGKMVKAINGAQVPILPAKFVDADVGTGVVYSVPAHAPYDWAALEDLKKNKEYCDKYGIYETVMNISPISIIKIQGYSDFPAGDVYKRMNISSLDDVEKLEKATKEIYKAEFYNGVLKENCEKFAGMKINEIKDEVKNWMKKYDSFNVYETNRKANCRCGGKIIVAVLNDQWFLDFNSEWKAKAKKCLDRMEIIPEIYRKQFEDTFDWLDKRPCARKRGIGTKLPFDKEWIIESLSDSTIYMAYYTIIKKIREMGIKVEQMNYDFFEGVFLGADAEKVAEKTGVEKHKIEELNKEFNYWYPNDHRHTAIGHISNHLTFFIFAHAGIFPEKYWPKKISLNNMLIREGVKMSKSKGNVIPLNEIGEKCGPDLFRLYVCGGADLNSLVDWKEADVEALRGMTNKLYETISSDIIPKRRKGEMGNIGKWMMSRFNKALKEIEENLEKMKMREYVQIAFYQILNDYQYFKRRCTDENELMSVNYEICEKWIKALAPAMPHICEELYHMVKDEYVSTAKWSSFDATMINEVKEKEEDVVKQLMEDTRNIIELKKLAPKKIMVYTAPEWKWRLLRVAIESADGKFDMSAVIKKAMEDPEIKKYSSEVAAFVKSIAKDVFDLKYSLGGMQIDEYDALSHAKTFLSNELGAEVIIEKAEKSMEPKAKNAKPLKPAILIV